MAVPTDITDISSTASSNSPAGTDSIGTALDDYIRATQAIIKQNVSKGSDIASSTTITIPNEGSYFVITGTTAITGINDTWNGRAVILKFNDVVTLTNSAGLILFGGDITTAAGDVMTLINESTGVYRAINMIKASGGFITATGTDTLTNKTIVAANNTITTAASGTLATTELNAALAELEAEKLDISGAKAMTGNLSILGGLGGTNPKITLQPTSSGGNIALRFNDNSGNKRMEIATQNSDGLLTISRYSAAEALETQFILTATGHVYVWGSAPPTAGPHLTDKTYVDNEITTLGTAKADIASPTLTGVPAAPTAATTTDTTQIATTEFVQQEMAAASYTQRVIAWCNFDGTTTGTNAPTDGDVVTTVERLSTAKYQLTFSPALAHANYAMCGSAAASSNIAVNITGTFASGATDKTTTTLTIEVRDGAGGLSVDPKEVNISIMG